MQDQPNFRITEYEYDPDYEAKAGCAPKDETTMFGLPEDQPMEGFLNPLPGWERFQLLKLLGQGGMGRVYLAYDSTLRRHIAVKLMQKDDLATAKRFVSEARSQARVNHDRVCPVYEVGEAQGKTYIAMRYIEGHPLQGADLTLEEKVLVMKGAAEGLQAAHSVGLIHRDIKPGNIMVEKGDGSILSPFVMDFGLARHQRDDGPLTKGVAGTPHYMSPEQARGETENLDRRTDIYSMGATLYYLLMGRPPYTGENNLEVVRKVIEEEPKWPRELAGEIPADLKTITKKCLERNRADRYPSARDLADDLGRYLAGEPVLASSRGVFYRFGKKLQKHRLAASIIFLAILVVLFSLGSILKTRRASALRERLAREFTEKVEGIEARARYVDLSPSHDIRMDLEDLRTQMAEIEAMMARIGTPANGPGNYALGRGHFALGDYASSRTHLEQSWEMGLRSSRVAYTLGLVFSNLYQRQMVETDNIGHAALRKARRQELATLLRDPARSWLRKSRGAKVPFPDAYGQAMLAFLDGRFTDALGLLEGVDDPPPWFYELPKLEGDIHMTLANAARHRGDRQTASHAFEQGRNAYHRAIAIGESVPENYWALGELHHSLLKMELYSSADVRRHFEEGKQVLEKALSIQPQHYDSLVLQSSLFWRLAEHGDHSGEDTSRILVKALTAAREAVKLQPTIGKGWAELARVHRRRARALLDKGRDPSEALAKGVDAFERVPENERDYIYYIDRGNILKDSADFRQRRKGDPGPARSQSIAAYQKATELNAKIPDAFINMGVAYYQKGRWQQESDPRRMFLHGINNLNRVLALNPDHVPALYTKGQIHRSLVKYAHLQAQNPERELMKALLCFERAGSINRRSPRIPGEIGFVWRDLARACWERGEDPRMELTLALEALEHGVSLAPQFGPLYYAIGEVHRLKALFLAGKGIDPRHSVRLADLAFRKATELKRSEAHPTQLASAYLIQAEFEIDSGKDAKASLGHAFQALGQALQLDPMQYYFWLNRAQYHLLHARVRYNKNSAPFSDFEKSSLDLTKAHEMAHDKAEVFLATARWGYWFASWLTDQGYWAQDILEESLTSAERAETMGSPRAEVEALRLLIRDLWKRQEITSQRTIAWGGDHPSSLRTIEKIP